MEQTGMKQDVGAQSGQPEVRARRNLYLAIGLSILLAFCLIILLSGNDEVLEVELVEEPRKLFSVGPPKEEVKLMNYDDFLETYRLEEDLNELKFVADLLSIAQHNLATMSGEQTYYRRQSPFKAKLSDKYKDYSWSDLLMSGDGGGGAAELVALEAEEGPVSQASAELKKANAVGMWFQRLTKKESDFEIPNLPLEAQSDSERITHIDADLRSCLAGIKEQGKCGACYAFSWLSLAEWHYCRQLNTGELADFSEQHIVDCGHVARLNGCVEGKLTDAKDFSQVFGIHWERDYAYSSKKGACKKQTGSVAVKVNDFARIQVDREQFERTLQEQPILLEVHLPGDIHSYSSGIHPGHNCDSQLGHGMLLVGHGRQEGRPYWLLRNSMGKRWGENGYLRLARDMPEMGKCFKSAFVAKFRFKSLAEEKYVDFYDSLQFEPALDESRAKRGDDLKRLLAGN